MKYQRVTPENPTENPLDRPLAITIFPDARAKSKTDTKRTLRELARLIPGRAAASKAELRLLKLATFGDQRTPKGALRHNANLLAIEGIEGDYDGERLSVASAAKRLRKAGIAGLFYTSPSHRPDAPRWRILCPTSRALPPAERDQLMARLMGVLDGALSPESFTLSQTYYYGRVDGQPAPAVELVDGRAIDLADDLDAGALDKHGEPWGAEAVEPDDDDDMVRAPDVERITRDLALIPSDEREIWLRVGQALHHEFDGDEDGFALWDEWSQSSDKHDADDQRRVWESFGSFVGKAVTIATVHRLARQYRPKTFGDLTFHTPSECAEMPSRGYVVKGLLAPGDIASIFGAPGAGKSTLSPHTGYMVALGDTAFGMRTKPGVVFYVAAEDATGLRQRVRALMLRHGDAPDFRVVGGVSDLFDEDSADLDALLKAVADQRPVLIIIDTLAMAFPGLEENDAASMVRVVTVARQLAEHGAAVVLVHHDTKAEGSTPRGHSVFNGALDMALHVKRDEDGIIRGKLTKNRNGSPDRDIAFRISTETLGTDEDGDPITAPLVEELTGLDAVRPVRVSAAQREALSILSDLEADGRVSEEAWRDACLEGRRVSQSEDRDSRKRVFNRVRTALFEKRLIAFRDGDVSSEVTSEEDDD